MTGSQKYSLALNAFILLLLAFVSANGANFKFLFVWYFVVLGGPSLLVFLYELYKVESQAAPQRKTPKADYPANDANPNQPQHTGFNRPQLWQGEDLSGKWLITRKADGVRALKQNGQIVTTGGNFFPIDPALMSHTDDAEIYFGDWTKSLKALHGNQTIKAENIYSLDNPDPRLIVGTINNPSKKLINNLLKQAIDEGWEGLVLRQGNNWLKVKKSETHDIAITGIKKRGQQVLSLTTEKGCVPGLTDKQKAAIARNSKKYIGKIIEVEAMELTKNGKFREPRFIRFRDDKTPTA